MISFAKNRCFFLTSLIVLTLLLVIQCASAELGSNVYGYNESNTLNWTGYEPITLDKYYPRYEAFDGRSHWDNWYANVFTAGSDEQNTGSDVEVITAVSFYAKTQVDHDIYIYFNPDSGNPATGEPLSHTYVNSTKINTGELNYVNLSTSVPICNGNTFSVVIKVHADSSCPIPIEWTWYEGDQIKYPSCTQGQSYIGYQGYNGLSWVDMKDTSTEYSNSNVWIKAYTEERANGDEVQGVIFVSPRDDFCLAIGKVVNSASIIVVNPGTYYENLVINKEISILSKSGNPEDTIIKSGPNSTSSDVFKVTSDNVTIRGFSIEGARYYDPLSGIHLENADNCFIANNILSDNWEGIYLKNSSGNILVNNIVKSNSGYGFYLLKSRNNTFAQNKVNSNDDGGFYLKNSKNNVFKSNNVSTSEGYGFHLSSSSNNSILSNNISENGYGIRMEDESNSNSVSENKILQNRAYGISPYYSNYNIIFDNYFYNINNTFFEEDSSKNQWNTILRIKRWNIVYGDYEGGNYWGQPDGNGFSQNYNDTTGDGICDDSSGSTVEYKLTKNSSSSRIDHLPLADPNIRLVGLGNNYPYNRIQDALDHSKDNFTTIIHPGDYSDSVCVYREVKIKSNSTDPRKVNVSYNQSEDIKLSCWDRKNSVFYVISNNVSISGLTVKGGDRGIWLSEVQRCTINNSCFSDNIAGIYLTYSKNNNLTNNNAFSNNEHGIWLFESCNNSLRNNIASQNQNSGFYVSFSSNNNNLSGNIAASNELRGIWVSNSSDSNTFVQNNISNNEYGIYLEYADNNTLSNNNASENGFGIYLWTSVENVIKRNLITQNKGILSQGQGYGIYLAIDSKNNTVWANNISSNRYGARLGSHADNNHFFANYFDNLVNNTLFETTHINCWNSSTPKIYVYKNNTYLSYLGNYYADYTGNDSNFDGIGDTPYWENGDKYPVIQENWPVDLKVEKPVKNLDTGEWFDTIQEAVNNADDFGHDTIVIYPGTYTENVVVNKSVTIKSASENSKDTIVHASSLYDHVFNINSDNVTIMGLTLKGAYGHDPCSGIYLKGVRNCIIKDNTLLNNWYGIYAVSSDNITIKNNEAEKNRDYGIKLFNSSNQKIFNNKVNSNDYGGIYLFNSRSNSLKNNNASSNLWYGVQLNSSSYNTLENNTVNSNENSGIYLKSSNGNEVWNNTLELNSVSGIFLNSSSSNLISNNYFYNSQNARFAGSNFNNLWNTTKTTVVNIVGGPTLGGNYWAKPDGNGFSQTYEDSDGDGICDEAYNLATEEDAGAEGENIDNLPLYFPRTLRVNWDGTMEFETIQGAVDYAETEAVNYAGDGFTIVVYPGTYTENVNVSQKLTIRSYSGNPEDTSVKASSSEAHVFNVGSDNVNIEGFSIIGKNKNDPYSGIFLGKAKNCNIENNYLSESYYGIYLDSCQNITLQNNTANSNSGSGIYLNDSKNNSLFNNTANSNSVSGICLKSSASNSLINNTANSNSVHGIWLYSASKNNTLCNNTAKWNTEYGIVLEYSCSYNNLSYNNVSSNSEYGLCLKHSSDNNTLIENSANSNLKSGFWLYNCSSNNELIGNTADANSEYGIYLYNSSNSNFILQNNVSSNGVYGIYLRASNSNELGFSNNSQFANNSQLAAGNRIENNSCGICLDNSHKNLISNNYFNNARNTYFEGPNTENRWNTTKTEEPNVFGGPYLGGNFWAKPDGTGLSQVNRDLTGDGILNKKLDNSKRVVELEYRLSPSSSQEIVNPEELNVDYLPLAQTITVDCEGNKSKYTSIGTALKNAENGYSLAVYPGNYSENLQIDKNLAIISISEQTENATENTTIRAKNSGLDVFNVSSSGVIISGFSITGANGTESSSGIHLRNAKNCTLSNNLVSNNSVGIWLEFSGGASGENILSNNSMFSNRYNFKDSGTLINDISKSNIVGKNREEGKTIYYLCNSSNLEINSSTEAGVVYCIDCENIIIKDLVLENNSKGISFYNTTNSIILNNTLFNNFDGIALNSSLRNTLESNHANANENSGIFFSASDFNNVIKNNATGKTARGERESRFGFLLKSSDNNTLENNIAQENSISGFSILASENNTILGNKLTSNSNAIFLDDSSYTELYSNIADSNTYGFYLNSSENNTLNDNELLSNSDSGIYLNSSSEFNKLGNNTFSGNQFGIQVQNSYKNTFLKNQVSENEYGIILKNSSSNNLSSNSVVSNSLYGIFLESSGKNLIFNNYFNNLNNTDPFSENSENFWNTTKTPGINIVEGPWLGGNFWATPSETGFSQTCEDIDEDYICTKYNISSNNVDYFPLVAVPDSIKVAPQLEPPTVNYTAGLSPLSVNFTASSSSNVKPVEWSWDFGDGSSPQNGTFSGSDYSGSVSHTYTLPEGLASKTYTVTLTVRNVYSSANKTCEVLVVEPIVSSLSINGMLVNINDSTKEIIINSTLPGENVQILENKTLLVRKKGIELYIYSTGLEKDQSGNWTGKYTYAKLEKTAEFSELWGNFSSSFSFNASFYGNLSALLNPDAGIACGVVPGLPGSNIETAFNNSLSASNLELGNTTYSLIIEKRGLAGIKVKDANIFMTAPSDYINENGGPEKYTIMSWNEAEESSEKLTTDYSVNDTFFEFIGFSPEGFSVKSLLSFSSKPTDGTSQSSSGGGSSGGSGGGGASSPEDQDNIELKELTSAYVISGTHVKFDFPLGVTCVNYLEFDAKRSFGKVSAFVEMLKGQSSLVSSLPDGVIYKNLNIWMGSEGVSNSSNMENAIVGFKVNKTWVETENINVSTITLHRYNNGSWSALPTYSIGENGSLLLFEAETPAFSPFVITGLKEPEVAQTQVTQTPAEEETEAIASVSEETLENNWNLKTFLKKFLPYGTLTVIVLLSALLIRKKIFSKTESSGNDIDNVDDIENADLEEADADETDIDEFIALGDDSYKTTLSEALDSWDENENEYLPLTKPQDLDEEESTKVGNVVEMDAEDSGEKETLRTDVEEDSEKDGKDEKDETESKKIEEDSGEKETLKTDIEEGSEEDKKDETESKEIEENPSVKEESFKQFLSQLRKPKDSEKETSAQEKESIEDSEASLIDEESEMAEAQPPRNVSGNEDAGEEENSFKAFLSQLKKRNLSEEKKSEREK